MSIIASTSRASAPKHHTLTASPALRLPRRLAPCRPPRPRTTHPCGPRQLCVYHQKRAKKRRQTFVTPRHAAARDSLGTHPSRLAARTPREPEHSTPIPRPAAARTTHFAAYASIRACLHHLLSPSSPAEPPAIIIFFRPIHNSTPGPAGGVPKKIHSQQGASPPG